MSSKKHPNRQFLPPQSSGPRASSGGPAGSGHWVYGWHAVNAALANPERSVIRIVASNTAAERLVMPARKLPNPHIMEPREIDRILGAEAVHQGIGAEVRPLEPYTLEDIIHIDKPSGPIVILDQVSDPQNVGAIMRSAAAYDAVAVIFPKDHSAPETPAMAKAACGALDMVKRVQVTNLASAMRELKDAGWWIIGLEGEATKLLSDIKHFPKTVIVLGAEGKGMRRLTAEVCDERARLPMGRNMESLNVSNAAAISLYQLFLTRPSHG
ncbi:MAG: 23S rRNA (guanosine(2251)-2'-O)-methyltransferase RlmB [Pseudomonadota bacterium]